MLPGLPELVDERQAARLRHTITIDSGRQEAFRGRIANLMSDEPVSVLTSFESPASARATTGIEGLDYVLGGGFPRNRIYLIEGHPGSGKTTLGLQFLLEGQRQGETGLCITLSENREELELVANSHGWSVEKMALYELEKLEDQFNPETQYTVFHPGEVELSYTIRQIRNRI
jgi:circadian clock protein KaiC